MPASLTSSDALSQAVALAVQRSLMPTALGSGDLQELLQRMKRRVFFSARTTNLWYLDRLKALSERFVLSEGRNNDLARLRIEARENLARMGYVPEQGFPGDDELGVPPALPGTLQDLSSEKRLNLIFTTQQEMAFNLGRKIRGLRRAGGWPAWALERVSLRAEPRAWLDRWEIAADNTNWQGASREAYSQGRMIALKTSPIWAALGSSALFPDAINSDHPPFAFSSGMGWREVPLEQVRELPDLVEAMNSNTTTAAQTLRDSYPDYAPPVEPQLSATERAAKLERFERLRAKFDEIQRARGQA